MNTDAYARSTEDDRDTLKSSSAVYFAFAGDGIINALDFPGIAWQTVINSSNTTTVTCMKGITLRTN